MDFTWEAMETADQRVKQLRRRLADWAPGSTSLGEAARTFDARFRSALADDLSMPGAVVVVNGLTSSPGVPAGEKYSLLAAWDEVLGLDLEREARSSWEPTDEVRALMTERDVARAARDYGKSDELRDRLAGMGMEVMDTAEGTRVRPRD
jgi:cysteinyl-tRNA synthetase